MVTGHSLSCIGCAVPALLSSGLDSGFLDAGLDLTVTGIDDNGVASHGLFSQEHFAQGVLNFALDGTLQRAGTILDVKPTVSHKVLGSFGDLKFQSVFLNALVE